MNITDLELKAITNIARNLMTSANGGIPSSPSETECWVDCIIDQGPIPIEPRSLPGVIASLVKKGLAKTDGEIVRLTEAGLREYLERKEEQP